MKVIFEQVDSPAKEEAVIRAQSQTVDIKAAIDLLEGNERKIPLIKDGNNVFVETSALYYIESVDNRNFIYTKDKVYETRQKLYELEDMLKEKHFLRVSKSTLLNLMKVSAIKPALNSRFTAVLFSGEQIIITRKYVPELKKALKGE